MDEGVWEYGGGMTSLLEREGGMSYTLEIFGRVPVQM